MSTTRFTIPCRMGIVCGAILMACPLRAQEPAIPARAKLENGIVTIRTFSVPTAPFPGIPQGNSYSPRSEAGEHRMQFSAGDILAFHPDGKPAAIAAWQSALGREAAVLFLGHALVDPGGPPARRESIHIPAHQQALYKEDALVLFGARSPVQQAPAGKPQPSQGVQPLYGTVSATADGMIHVAARYEARIHYYAPTARGDNSHIFQTTTVTTTRTLPCADVRVWTPDGKRVASSTLPQWLTQEYPAMISGDGGEIDPLFLELLKPHTPVVAVPALPPREFSPTPPGGLLPAPPR